VSKQLTTTSHAVLALLRIRPWTTYELAKQVQRSLGWFWPRAERKLYDEPKHLVAAGLATAVEERTGNRARTVYTITAAGRRALRSWLGEPPAPPALEFEAMVKVFFADGGTLEQLRSTLDVVEATANARLAALRSMIDTATEPSAGFASRQAVNARSMRFQLDHEALLGQWAAWAREQTSSWRSPTDPGDWDPAAALA
jgi:DNA-binding PadR family transcriptional regulator